MLQKNTINFYERIFVPNSYFFFEFSLTENEKKVVSKEKSKSYPIQAVLEFVSGYGSNDTEEHSASLKMRRIATEYIIATNEPIHTISLTEDSTAFGQYCKLILKMPNLSYPKDQIIREIRNLTHLIDMLEKRKKDAQRKGKGYFTRLSKCISIMKKAKKETLEIVKDYPQRRECWIDFGVFELLEVQCQRTEALIIFT
eukprot:TRINITY_DN13543_c0_g1_i3.p1 TRINITY_DN13543_c0_g1~~TRINITY_DN13543_c0_g1_i3.p1  ORF type:complete len:199 (-),score=21.65 TRINITY_DN13543_c0_g1_i3:207-803(-)